MRREFRKYARQAVWPAVGGLLVAYFAYHLVQGERGLLAYLRLQAEIAQAEAVLAATEAERAEWEQQVGLLRPDSLDLDMLEERARIMLNQVRPDEVIILTPGPIPAAR